MGSPVLTGVSVLTVTPFLRPGGGQLRRIRRTLTVVERRWVSTSILTSATCTMSAQARAGHSVTLAQRELFSAWSQGNACLRKRWSAPAETKRRGMLDVYKRRQRWNEATIVSCYSWLDSVLSTKHIQVNNSSYVNWITKHILVNKSHRFGKK